MKYAMSNTERPADVHGQVADVIPFLAGAKVAALGSGSGDGAGGGEQPGAITSQRIAGRLGVPSDGASPPGAPSSGAPPTGDCEARDSETRASATGVGDVGEPEHPAANIAAVRRMNRMATSSSVGGL